MKKALLLLSVLLITGCTQTPTNTMTADVCELFDTEVELCWCSEGPDKILYESNQTINNETQASELISEEFNVTVDRAVNISKSFYNVFTENEEVYTVSNTGTVIKTICGV